EVATLLKLEIGVPYLAYLRTEVGGVRHWLPGSVPVSQATEDLAFLDSLLKRPRQGRIVGKVQLRNCEVVPNAKVELERDHQTLVTTTDANGRYVFEELEPGEYRARASAAGGFASRSFPLQVKIGDCHFVPFRLQKKQELPWNHRLLSLGVAGYDWVMETLRLLAGR
ncbi:MAG: carboxypeptidase regulatory-like domain-containing protein, partial [bacterium]|nr:carboxypeptidase regulatory-like domain-containing protein [bacterium]